MSSRSEQNPATREDFVAFLRELKAELSESDSQWRNCDLESFLEALAAWTEDCDGFYQNFGKPVPVTPSWSMLADMFKAATVYE